MTNQRPLDAVESLRNTRRSMGDGTAQGRARIATPVREGSLRRGFVGLGASGQPSPGTGSGLTARRGETLTVTATTRDVNDAIEWSDLAAARIALGFDYDLPDATITPRKRGYYDVIIDRLELAGSGGANVRVFAGDREVGHYRGPGKWKVLEAHVFPVDVVRAGEEPLRVEVDQPITSCKANFRLVDLSPGQGEEAPAFLALYINDTLIDQVEGRVSVDFSTATLLLGQQSFSPDQATEMFFDDAVVQRDDSPGNLLGNPGFEDALPAHGGTGRPVVFDNWGRYQSQGTVADRSQVQVHSGAWSGRVPSGSGFGQGKYFYQDLPLAPGDWFDLVAWIYPTNLGSGQNAQSMAALFDWDRSSGNTAGSAGSYFFADRTTCAGFGLQTADGPPLALNQWSKVQVRVWVNSEELS